MMGPTNGYLAVLVLVFGSIFFVILTAFMGFVINQKQAQDIKKREEQALAVAEAGINYYKWYLAHNPNDLTNGTGEPGPFVFPYHDPEGGELGQISLSVTGTNLCGDITSIEIESTGTVADDPGSARTIYARYARPTVAEYAYIINANVWAGEDRTIVGPYHSNGIIRMDGTNNSTVSSGQESWQCDEDELPCDPDDDGDTVDAVYGDGSGSDLWIFPTTPVSFAGLTVDLATIQDRAEDSGLYIGPSNRSGYRIRFESDGTIDVYRVTRADAYWGYSSESGWQQENNVITTSSFVGSYTIPVACPVIFVEDKVWLDGVVNGKVTIAAADVDSTGIDPSIVLNGNITYANDESGLLAIGERDVLVGLAVPDDTTANGIFMAQKGRFGRNHYCTNCSETVGWWSYARGLPSSLDGYVYRDSLTVNGTIVSNGREGTKWVSSGGTYISGFETRFNSYDRDLVSSPPPLTPDTSDEYEFIEWREME